MITDARAIDDRTTLDADICIVGAGAAGLILALNLDDGHRRIVILESGGIGPSAKAQSLASAESVGLAMLAPEISRVRAFGGTTRRWAGFCRPLDRDDFLQRDWIPHSGWPFGYEELAPHYRNALGILDVEMEDFDPKQWSLGIEALDRLLAQGGRVVPANLPRTPRRYFHREFHKPIARSRRIDVVLNAVVERLGTNEAGTRVERVQVTSLSGRHFEVHARTVVLAAGGIENPRLLLLSDDTVATGLGNGSDLVGRMLMNHPQLAAAWVVPKEGMSSVNRIWRRTAPCAQRLSLTPETLEAEGIGKFSAFAFPVHGIADHPWAASTGLAALTALLGRNARAAVTPDRAALMRELLTDLDGLFRDLALKTLDRFRDKEVVCILAETEQAPNPDSRVTLSDKRDRFGLRQARVDWRLTRFDKRTMSRGVEILDEDLTAAGLGGLVNHAWLVDDETSAYPGQDWAHHVGTTRMHDDPSRGVVDRNLRVHGIDNLYVCGCSVFPTEGMTPPTLTILALSLRLAEHLSGAMAQRVAA